MNFAFSEEQDLFRETLRRFLEEKSPASELFRLMEDPRGFDPDVWKQMGAELGLQGLLVPEAHGGQGFGFLEMGIALEEMGRVLLPGPFLASACVATSAILAAASDAQQAAWLPALASGERTATLALAEPGAGFAPEAVAMEAQPADDGLVLDGTKEWVLDGMAADQLLVVARRPGSAGEQGLCLLSVDADAPGVEVEALPTLDATRRQARVRFSGARAEALGEPGGAGPALARTLDRAAIGLAAEMAGGAQRCLELAVAYAGQRSQFARPIGSFQAIKHKCAEVLLEVELARSAAWWACWTAAEDNEERGEAAHLAKACCSDAFQLAARENIQIHGGIGFTWESPAHLYYRRAKVGEMLFGDPATHRAQLVEAVGIGS